MTSFDGWILKLNLQLKKSINYPLKTIESIA